VRTLVIGLGNPTFQDDNVGPRVARSLSGLINRSDITIAETSVGGLDFLELLTDFNKVIIIDAFQSQKSEAGRIYRVKPEALISQDTIPPHNMDFISAIELAKHLGLPLPDEIIIFGIEVGDITSPENYCTPQVEEAIPVCAERVLQELN